jgi:hypothetical protein
MSTEAREKVRAEIERALGRGIVLDALVQLDIGASGELMGRTKIRVRDLIEALGIPIPEGAT